MNIQEIIDLDQSYYMKTFGDRIHVMFTGGKGCVLQDSEGNEYLDFLAGISVNALGYGHPALVKAISEQAGKLIHCSNYFYIETQSLYAAKLVEHTCADRVFFGNSGAEANEGAIKLARKYFHAKGQDKYEIISAINSFHGRTIATLAATGQEKYRKDYVPMPAGFINVPYKDIDAVKAAITKNTAAIFVEPIQGEGGIIEGGEEYLQALRKLCDENEILLIFDEIQTGMGRTGKLFAYENYSVEPDIFTSAKALGGGLPLGAVLCKEKVSAFAPGDHGTTFGGNPVACAAGLVVLGELTSPGFLENVVKSGEYLKNTLNNLMKKYPAKIVEVRGRGLMLGAQIADGIPVKSIQKAALKKGFIVGVAGMNTLRLMPPLIIKNDQIDLLAKALDEIFEGAN